MNKKSKGVEIVIKMKGKDGELLNYEDTTSELENENTENIDDQFSQNSTSSKVTKKKTAKKQ